MRIETFSELISAPEFSSLYIRDAFVAIRTLVVVITIYLAIKVAKNIKGSGIISTVTGMTLYIIGNAVFQTQSSLLILYPDDEFISLTYYSASIFHLATMAIYSIFYEVEIKRYSLLH